MKDSIAIKENEFYVVGIGASAGGLDAIQVLFDNLPRDTGMAFVIVQHLSPTFKSLMDELLAKHTKMPIKPATDGVELEPNTIYLNPKEKNIICQNGKIKHLDKDTSYPLNLPIDIFFHSLGNDLEHKSIGIILSGTGTDGSRGISTIKESGGTVIVQEPESAQFDGMPVTAINSQFADYILKPELIGEELVRIASGPSFILKESDNIKTSSEEKFNKIIEVLSKHSGIDFSAYKPNTLIRRIEKRANIKQLNNLDDYYKLIKNEKEEQEALFRDCLIGVTAFFRDPETFREIKENVLPRIFSNKQQKKVARFWVIGCSTGEEAYSLAIIIDEFLSANNLVHDYKIFATDADAAAVQIASAGAYQVNLITDIPKARLEKYFVKRGNQFEILKRIREKIVFSTHNILKDPPFIRMDFISCRNVLIYMNNKSQKKITNTLHFALNLDGFLFLGNSENLNDIKDRFEIIDSKLRIYRNISETRAFPTILSDHKLGSYSLRHPSFLENQTLQARKMLSESAFNRHIAETFGPSCIYIDEDLNVLFINGDVGDYLSYSRGLLKQNLMEMANSEKLSAILHNGIRRLREQKKTIAFNKFAFESNGKKMLVNIKFKLMTIEGQTKDVFVIIFEREQAEADDVIVFDQYKLDEASKQRIHDLEDQLKQAKEETQNAIEELETSNEELQASNEELQASNEELQSTNEELQSVNEELYTINSELQVKNRELYDLNNDMHNMLNNTNIALLFLNKKLHIRLFTPELKRLFNLEDSDIDRPINSFASNFINISGKELAADVEEVIKTLVPKSKELESEDKKFYLKRILPYKTVENGVEGAVITFLDITEVRARDIEMKSVNERLELALQMGKLAWWDWDYITGKVNFSDAKALMLGYKPEEIKDGVYDFTSMIHPDDYEETMQIMRDHLQGKRDIYEAEYRIRKKDGTYTWFYDKGGIVSRDSKDNPLRITGIVIDISEKKEHEEEINRLYKAFLQSPTPNLITDNNGFIEFVNESHCNITGYTRKELIGKKTSIFKSGKHSEAFYKALWNTISQKKVWQGELANKKKNGEVYWEQATISPIMDQKGEIVNYMKVAQEITSRMMDKEKLRTDKLRAEEADKLKSVFLANMSHEIRTPMNAIVGFGQLLENGNLSEKERKQFIQIINSQGEYLLSLINDIIDISKIEARAIDLREEFCDINYLLDDLEKFFIFNRTNDVNIIRSEKGIDFNPLITTDATRLRQILNNLIGNAVKFTEKGYVEFGVELMGNHELRFYVKDTGIGIRNSAIDKIFDRFYQVDASGEERSGKGTGLGLAITKALVELFGGRIWAESEEYVGSTFYFTIPYHPIEATPEYIKISPEKYQGIFKDRKILIVEDIESNYLFVAHALEDTGAVVHWARNGKEAIEKLKNDGDISAILMDLSMPVLDGFETTRKIRQMNKSIPIIAQTAHALEGDKNKALDAGCDDYITKPIIIENLINILNMHLSVIGV